MSNYSHLSSLLFLVLFSFFASQVFAGASHVNSVIEEGRCGHEGIGKIQYLQNSDQDNDFEVTVKTTEERHGEKTESTKTHKVKAGGKKYLGCNFSEVMPLISYKRTVVSESVK
jgi:hypothetical protein